jgi:hypothetical protein
MTNMIESGEVDLPVDKEDINGRAGAFDIMWL